MASHDIGRRIGLNPAEDYGGFDQRAQAGAALREIKAANEAAAADQEIPTLFDEVDTTVPVTEATPQVRATTKAQLGSRALKGTQSTAHELTVGRIVRDDGTGRSAAAQRRLAELDMAQARSNFLSRGPGH